MKILLVDDDRDVCDAVTARLRSCGFVIDPVQSGERAVLLAHVNEYDLVILDLNLPDMSGIEVCGSLRNGKHSIPVLMLSVVSDADSKVRLLNAGADDYLAKPFSFEELAARVRALLRRPSAATGNELAIGDVVLDTVRQTARRGERDLKLTRKEFALLEQLMRSAGAVVPKTTLIEHAWDSRANAFSAAIETHMANLRRKLDHPEFIHTVYGRGYKIRAV